MMCEMCRAAAREFAGLAGGFGIEVVVVDRGRGADEGFERARQRARKQSTTLTLDGEQWAMLRSLSERELHSQRDPQLREIAESAMKVLQDNAPPEPEDDEPAGDKDERAEQKPRDAEAPVG